MHEGAPIARMLLPKAASFTHLPARMESNLQVRTSSIYGHALLFGIGAPVLSLPTTDSPQAFVRETR